MYFLPSKMVVMLALAAMAFSAPAQQTVIFSKPADLSADKANSFLPGSAHRAGDYNAPHEIFHDYAPDLPMPQPLLLPGNNASVKEALDRRKNWTLLTPEQILGVQTPEEILGVPDKTGEKNLSLEEQFLLRESRTAAAVATNGRAGAASWREKDEANPFEAKNNNDENDPFRQEPQKIGPGARYFSQLLNNAQDSGADADGKSDSPWNSAFGQPDQPKPTPEQLADMERFRALMEPSSPPDKVQVPTRFSTPAPDSFLQQAPVVNPNGRGIAPLENLFSQPTGIKPLPGVSTPPPTPVATKPSWQAQLPPWMMTGPQAHNPSQNY